MSTGIYAGLNLGVGSNDLAVNVAQNRALVTNTLGAKKLVSAYQYHSAEVVEITGDHDPTNRPKADGMVTRAGGVALCILTADCVPVLFADAKSGIVGAAHAGWRGAYGGVCESTLDKMCALGANAGDIHAAIGPAIQQASYQVDAGFRDTILTKHTWAENLFLPDGTTHFRFDLCGYVARRLEAWGLDVENISDVGVDVFSVPADYFSNRHRLHLGQPDYGRNGSVIMLDS